MCLNICIDLWLGLLRYGILLSRFWIYWQDFRLDLHSLSFILPFLSLNFSPWFNCWNRLLHHPLFVGLRKPPFVHICSNVCAARSTGTSLHPLYDPPSACPRWPRCLLLFPKRSHTPPRALTHHPNSIWEVGQIWNNIYIFPIRRFIPIKILTTIDISLSHTERMEAEFIFILVFIISQTFSHFDQ